MGLLFHLSHRKSESYKQTFFSWSFMYKSHRRSHPVVQKDLPAEQSKQLLPLYTVNECEVVWFQVENGIYQGHYQVLKAEFDQFWFTESKLYLHKWHPYLLPQQWLMLLFDLVLSQRSKMVKVSLFSISPIPPLLKSCLSQGYSNSDTPFQ